MSVVKKIIVLTGILLLLYFILQINNVDIDLINNKVRSSADQVVSGDVDVKDTSEINKYSNSVKSVSSQNKPVSGSGLEPEILQALEKHINTSSEGLEEVDTSKGINVNLQGRFHNVPVATVNEKGKIEISGYNSLPTPGKKND